MGAAKIGWILVLEKVGRLRVDYWDVSDPVQHDAMEIFAAIMVR